MKQETEKHLFRADELIQVAEENLQNNHPADSVSRSYYAMFHATTAVLMEHDIERGSHKGVICAFGETLSKTGRMEKRFHEYLRDAFDARCESDYLPLPTETIERAKETLGRAKEFVKACRVYVQEQTSS